MTTTRAGGDRYGVRERRFNSRSTAMRMNDTCVSSGASVDCMRASVPASNAASRFSGYRIFLPTRDWIAGSSPRDNSDLAYAFSVA